MTETVTDADLREPEMVSGADPVEGHLDELRTDPVGLLDRVRAEHGDVGAFRLRDKHVTLLSGAEANEWYFRMGDDILDQGAAYPFMTPIFGQGVLFDVPAERRREMLNNQALRGTMMKGHAETISREVERAVAGWTGPTEIDLLEWFAELTIYTSSACLVGPKFREELDSRFAHLYHDLERGTDALAFVDAYAPIESFQRRDEARRGLVGLIEEVIAGREGKPVTKEDRDLLDILLMVPGDDGASRRFSADEITGIFISMMFAGHHTTSGTAAWTLIELLRRPDYLARVVAELDGLYDDGAEVSFQALREIPLLESAIKEALRLHPPLILLLRVANEDLEVNGYRIRKGDLVGASPSVSNRIESAFPDPGTFDPERYLDPRREDDNNPWSWIPFGAGKHRCVGAAFAMMQLKAIFSVLLHRYTFELAQPSDSYRDDFSKMVIQLEQPCTVRLRPRER